MSASALYQGTVIHSRATPTHRFEYPIRLVYLDLGEVDDVLARHPLWSANRWSPVQFRRSDHLGDHRRPLAEAVRDVVEEATGRRPLGPVRTLTQLRTLGWLFNPITLHYCFPTETSEAPSVAVADVTNTPWHESHQYLVPVGPEPTLVAKQLHVSPFMPMEQAYRFVLEGPDRRLTARIDNLEEDRVVHTARLDLVRRPLDRRAMSRHLWAHPLSTVAVSARIYRQALSLRRSGAAFHPHPDRTKPPEVGPDPPAVPTSMAA